MTIGVVTGKTLCAVVKEVTEGVPVTPTLGSQFLELLKDGFEFIEAKEIVERNNLTSSIGKVAPRTSIKTVTGSLPVELKASGTEGGAPQYGLLLEAGLGAVRNTLTKNTEAGSTTSNIALTAHGYLIGDFIVLKLPLIDHGCYVSAVPDADNFTIFPPAPLAVPTGTKINAQTTYYPTNENQPTFTTTFYFGDQIKSQGGGCRPATIALENFATGQIASLNFGFEGINFSRVDGSAPVAPTYQPGLPPVVLGAILSMGGTCIKVNEVTFTVENTIAPLTTVCSPDGKIATRFSERKVTGTFNPYLDDTLLTYWDLFKNDTIFSLTLILGNPDTANTQKMIDGSICGIYFPKVTINEDPIADQDGIMVENIAFTASTGDGTSSEIFISFS